MAPPEDPERRPGPRLPAGRRLQPRGADPIRPDSVPILRYRDVTVVPFASLLEHRLGLPRHQGGPIWPDWDDEPLARYFRGSHAVDTRPAPQPHEIEIDDDDCYWIGPVWPHFGHVVTDFTTRTLPTLEANRRATFVFATVASSGIRTLRESPVFFREVLRWYGVRFDRILFVDRPTGFRSLQVVPQPERRGSEPACAPDPLFLDALTALTRHRLGTVRREGLLFVSRSGMPNRFAGEALLDHAFRAAGATVLHPERVHVGDQLRAYATHRTVVFSEGSAVHGLQLLGRNLGRVVVLRRRHDRRFAEHSVSARAESYTLLEASRAFVTGLEPDGRPNGFEGVAVLDDEALLAGLQGLGIDLRAHWPRRAFARAQAADLQQWVRARGRTLALRHPGSLSELLSGLHRSRARGARRLAARLRLAVLRKRISRRLRAGIRTARRGRHAGPEGGADTGSPQPGVEPDPVRRARGAPALSSRLPAGARPGPGRPGS